MPEPQAPSGKPGEAEAEAEADAELGPGESALDPLGALEVAEAQAAGYFEPEPGGDGEAP